MPYVDPSRVQLALRYAELAERSPVEWEPATEDLKVFLAVLWADATSAARNRYAVAAARPSVPPPWAAVTRPVDPGELPMRGPAVVELLLGHADPDDEGVPGYRLVAGDPHAEVVLAALREWDTEELARVAEPAGWRLGEPADAASEDAPADDVSESQEVPDEGKAEDVPSDGPSEAQEAPQGDAGGEGQSTPEEPTGALWKLGAVAAGFGALVFVARKWG
jgi:hypothetical protein